MSRAQLYREALREQWKELTMPSNGAKFLVGQISALDYFKFQQLGVDTGMAGMSAEELEGVMADKDKRNEVARKIVDEQGYTLQDMADLLVPAFVKDPKIVAGSPPANPADDVIYVGELDPRDLGFLMQHIMKALQVEELDLFREE